jgi:hypothetical protein
VASCRLRAVATTGMGGRAVTAGSPNYGTHRTRYRSRPPRNLLHFSVRYRAGDA